MSAVERSVAPTRWWWPLLVPFGLALCEMASADGDDLLFILEFNQGMFCAGHKESWINIQVDLIYKY